MPPSHDELWGRATELLPRLKERAPRCEELRRLPDETLRDFHDMQLLRIHQPRRVGGAELEFAAVVTFVNTGFDPGYPRRWLVAWGIALPAAVVAAYLFRPLALRLARSAAGLGKAASKPRKK